MAISQNPIIGRTKKTLGNVVFTTWKGRNVIKTRPLTVGNPRTMRQQNQRAKFAVLVSLSKALMAKAKKKFCLNNGTTEYNQFVSMNMQRLYVSPSGTVCVDMPQLSVSAGSIGGEIPTAVANGLAGVIDVQYTHTSNGGSKLPSDYALAGAFNSRTGEYEETNVVFSRNANHCTINYPPTWAGDNVHVYLFFRRPSSNQCSDSVYCGVYPVV